MNLIGRVSLSSKEILFKVQSQVARDKLTNYFEDKLEK